jgi:hypothetical protein
MYAVATEERLQLLRSECVAGGKTGRALDEL